MSLLGDRLLAIHDTFELAAVPHAFGGAIALAYCTQEPRGTRDIDVNIFLQAAGADVALDAMPSDVVITSDDRRDIRRDGQARLMWGETPVDVFFTTHEFHSGAASEVRTVPFEGRQIPVLGCTALMVFKAMFSRTQDWADIEEMLAAGIGGREALGHLEQLLGPDDPSTRRLAELIEQP